MRQLLGVVVILVSLLGVGASGLAIAQDQQTPQHEHPDEVDEQGYPEMLERWFGDRMGDIHVDCSEGLVVGNFDACEDLDEEYESYLERYVTVERETTNDDAERVASIFAKTREQQRDLAEQRRAFEQTRSEYEAAREDGDEARARSRARELGREARRIEALGTNVSSGLQTLDGDSGADLARAAERTNETVDEVTRIADEAEKAFLEPVTITVQADDEASFASPAVVSGMVRTENGTAVDVGWVMVRDDAIYREATAVDGNGTFEVAYQPAGTPTGPTNLTVDYTPAEDSPFLDETTWTTLDVTATSTTVEIAAASRDGAYGENVTATGTLTAAGDAVDAGTVRLSVREQLVGAVRTDADGRFTVDGRLPASVPDGNVSLRVAGGESGTALSPDEDSRAIEVAATETTLSATVSYEGDSAGVSGRLTTADGDPVGGEPVTVTMGESNRTVTTNTAGNYGVGFERPDERRQVVAVYDDPATNLESSRTTVTVDPPSDAGFGSIGTIAGAIDSPDFVDSIGSIVAAYPILTGLIVVALLAIVGGIAVSGWRWLDRGAGESSAAGVLEADLDPAVRPIPDDTTRLRDAHGYVESAPSTAVQLAFAAIRSTQGMDDARTHWEVYRAACDDLDGDHREALRTVTEAFEAATFSPEGVDTTRARTAVDHAERCLAALAGGDRPESVD